MNSCNLLYYKYNILQLIYLHNGERLVDTRRECDPTILNLTLSDARSFISKGNVPEILKKYLRYGIYACERGVRRTHYISRCMINII